MKTVVSVMLALAAASARPVRAQDSSSRPFAPPLADPKQPHFFAAWLWVSSPILNAQVSSVGLGEDITVIRGQERRWEINVAAGVFSQFNMDTRSNDLINTDFVIGFPFLYRKRALSARVRIYHQSSHLGDEFILSSNPTRVNLSFEALELLVAHDLGPLRAYGGGEYIVRREPGSLKPTLLHAGVEYRQSNRLLRVSGLGDGRLIAATDVKSSQERKWSIGWSTRLGLEFRRTVEGPLRNFSVQLQTYFGPAPYGQFYQDNVRSVGMGLHLSL